MSNVLFTANSEKSGRDWMTWTMQDSLKEFLVWVKMIYQASAGYLTDSVVGGILGGSIVLGKWDVVLVIIVVRLTVGAVVIKVGLIQLENEMALKHLNPYMDKKLKGEK